MSRSNVRLVSLTALFALAAHVACGDVTSDLITDASGGSAMGGSSSGGSAMGGSATGGSATAGSSGASPGGAGMGGSSIGGTSAGSGGTPECTTNDDCSGSERNICRVSDGVCVECTNNGPCDTGENCSSIMGECARPCAGDSDCIEEDDPYCAMDIGGFCVECIEDFQCPTGDCGNWQCNDR